MGYWFVVDMEKLPIGVLAQRFGNLGRRLWYMCLGADPDPVHCLVSGAKSMGHGKVLPPGMQQDKAIRYYCLHLCERLAARLRANQMTARLFFVGMKSADWGWLSVKSPLVVDTDNSQRYL